MQKCAFVYLFCAAEEKESFLQIAQPEKSIQVNIFCKQREKRVAAIVFKSNAYNCSSLLDNKHV
jgi:hypothetical protein